LNEYLTLWANELLQRRSSKLNSTISVTGERDQSASPKWDFAKIKLRVEPSTEFEVVNNVSRDVNNVATSEELQLFLNWAIFGMLDVLLVANASPLRDVRIVLMEAEVHRVDSSQMAFRMAGRDAGRKILDARKSGSTAG
jgi:translation elongation factor EF-G